MQPPKIDNRTYNDIIKEIKQILPFYAPLLKFDENQKDPTAALIRIFAQMHEGTLKNLNQVPEKNFLAFLNMLEIKLLSSQPARVPLTFKLSKGVKDTVFIKQGCKVTATPQDGGDPVVFETEKSLLAIPSKLQRGYYVSRQKDFISPIPPAIFTVDVDTGKSGKGAPIFDFLQAENIQSHAFYLGDQDLFNFSKPITFKIKMPSLAERLYDLSFKSRIPNPVRWYYCIGETEAKAPDWQPFESYEAIKSDGTILLHKSKADEIKLYTFAGIESRWIKCEVVPEFINYLIKIKEYPQALQGEWVLTPMEPDKAFYNNVPLNLVKGKYICPFGQTPRVNDTFYISCKEALTIKDADLTLSFHLFFLSKWPKNTFEAEISAKLSWEYWNGKSWARLKTTAENDLALVSNGKLTFPCPVDIVETLVNGEKSLWIRARIISGDYGKEVVIQEGQQYSLQPKYKIPCLENISLSASHTKRKSIDHFITCNNLDRIQYNRKQNNGTNSFEIINIPDDSHPSFYLGFDSAFEKGPVSILFSMEEKAYIKGNIPLMRWEYYSESGEWKSLQVGDDGTQGLTHTGILVFSMPPDFISSLRFGESLFWIRAVDINDKYLDTILSPPIPNLRGIYPNTAWASQSETLEDEIINFPEGSHGREFTLMKTPVIDQEIWVNEINILSETDRKDLLQTGSNEIKEIRDREGVIREFWVKWQPVEDILFSGPHDRSYEIDPAFGEIRFGDGVNGAILPYGINNIKAIYKTGGGSRGNLGAGEINTMKTSISFVEGVFNPEPSKGGFEKETREAMVQRAPSLIRNRGRAVSVKDFEELAMEASRSIARVKCLPNLNDKKACETGWVTMVVLPQSTEERPVCSLELIRRIEDYVLARTANIIAFSQNFKVINPAYIAISIHAVVKAVDIGKVLEVEKEILARLAAYLNPIRGGSKGNGWEFGRLPYFSDFYAILERIPGVDHVEDLSLLITDPDRRDVIKVDANRTMDMERYRLQPYGLVSNGKHSIKVKV